MLDMPLLRNFQIALAIHTNPHSDNGDAIA